MFDDFTQSYDTLEKAGIENPLFETLRLFDLLAGGAIRKTNLSGSAGVRIDMQDVIQKRKQGVPWEYILGQASFMGHTFLCSPDTFLPTEETQLLVDCASEYIRKKENAGNDPVLIEVGTGCGNLAVTIAMKTKRAKVLTSDINPGATEIAKKNVCKFNLLERISLHSGDFFVPFKSLGYEGKIDVVVCNPPYIPTGSLSKMPREIIDYEPRAAFDGGPYGIDFFRRLISESVHMLKPDGMLCFEIGERQEKLVDRLFGKNGGYQDVQHLMFDSKVRAMSAVKKI